MRTMQLKYFKPIVLLIGLMITIHATAQTGIIDRIVAQVGDEIIMLSDIQGAKLQLIQEGIDVNANMDGEILEELLFQKLLINQAKVDSIEVSDDAVNANMEQRIRYFEAQIGGREAMEKFYGKSIAQIKADFFEVIKDNMLAEQMKDKITENFLVTPKDVSNFFNKLPNDSIPYINSKISVAQLVLYPEVTEADKAKAKKRIEKLREDVVSKKRSFPGVVITDSEDPGSKNTDGDLGWQTKGTMVPEFEAAVFSLEKNEISDVFETQYGFHFVQLLDRRGDNYRCRHILISIKADDKALEIAAVKLDQIYRDILAGKVSFEDAVQEHSMDEDSKNSNGKIVNPYTSDYYWDVNNINEIDAQLYRVINNLAVGKVASPSLYSAPRQQQIGMRIVKLLNKTQPHLANLTDDYQLIQNACTELKKQEIIDEWISGRISGAYIRIDEKYKNHNFKYNWL